jgi:hypothetical protein
LEDLGCWLLAGSSWRGLLITHCSALSISTLLQVRLKSLKSETEAFIIFDNTSGSRIRALWLDFKGNEVGRRC